jgi:hypothetical protein
MNQDPESPELVYTDDPLQTMGRLGDSFRHTPTVTIHTPQPIAGTSESAETGPGVEVTPAPLYSAFPTPLPISGAPRFELGDLIGRGVEGKVWEAVQTSLDRMVAVKTLPPLNLPVHDEQQESLLLNVRTSALCMEARVAAALGHPTECVLEPTIHLVANQAGTPALKAPERTTRGTDELGP